MTHFEFRDNWNFWTDLALGNFLIYWTETTATFFSSGLPPRFESDRKVDAVKIKLAFLLFLITNHAVQPHGQGKLLVRFYLL